jgi:hypothetical protein
MPLGLKWKFPFSQFRKNFRNFAKIYLQKFMKIAETLKGQCHEIFDPRFFFIKQSPLGP